MSGDDDIELGSSRTLPSAAAEPTLALEITDEAEGRYIVREELARGGQSIVYIAHDTHLNREVAFKQPHLPEGAPAEAIENARSRFLREARVTATLEHPNIVPIYEIGRRKDGSLYCTQKLIVPPKGERDPRTLRRALKDCKSLPERLSLLRNVFDACSAIAYAHEHGVIHRDVKPDNVVLGPFGETVVLDWGLAKLRSSAAVTLSHGRTFSAEQPADTLGGRAIGTPSYMSPEQARGALHDVDERSDVWGLGAMLYELLTGAPPFLGESPLGTVKQVIDAPLVPVRDRVKDAPPELAAIAEKALQKNPDDRYPTARALAAELDAYLSGARVGSYRYSFFELLRLFVSRHKGVAIVSALSVLLLAIAAALLWQLYLQSQGYLQTARENLAVALIGKARDAEAMLNWDKAAIYYAQARAESDRPEARMGAMLSNDRARVPLTFLPGNGGAVIALAYSPDGALLAVGSSDHSVHLWDRAAKRELGRLTGHTDAVTGLAFSPDGQWLLSVSDDNSAKLWDVKTRAFLRNVATENGRLQCAAWAPDGSMVVIGGEQKQGVLIETQTWTVRARLPHEQAVYAVDFSRDSKMVVTASRDETARIWRVTDGQPWPGAPVLGAGSEPLLAARFSPDGKHLATAGRDATVRLWTLPDFALEKPLVGHTGKITSIAFSPDGRKVASGGADRTVRVFDTVLGQQLLGDSYGLERDVLALSYSPDGREIAWGGVDDAVWIRAVPDDPSPGDDYVRVLALQGLSDGSAVVTGESSYLVIRDERTLQPVRPPIMIDRFIAVVELSVSPDERLIAANCSTTAICVYDRITGEQRDRFEAEPARLQGFRYSPDGRKIAVGGVDHLIRIFTLGSSAPPLVLRGHEDSVFSVDFSPDGKLLASGSYDKTVRLWDAQTGAPLATLEGHAHGVRRVAFSPDGKLLASASWDTTVRIWDVAQRRELHVLRGHEDHVFALAWRSDGELLASGARDGTVRLWNPHSGEEVGRYLADENWVQAAAFTEDGRELFYAGYHLHRIRFPELSDPKPWLTTVLTRTGFGFDRGEPVRNRAEAR